MIRTLVSRLERLGTLSSGDAYSSVLTGVGGRVDQKQRWAEGILRDSLGQGIWVHFHYFYTIGSMVLVITSKF